VSAQASKGTVAVSIMRLYDKRLELIYVSVSMRDRMENKDTNGSVFMF
jgi:hypothetical protein